MVRGRWGHKAVFVPSTNMVYLVGGEVTERPEFPLEITNELLQLNVSTSSASSLAAKNVLWMRSWCFRLYGAMTAIIAAPRLRYL